MNKQRPYNVLRILVIFGMLASMVGCAAATVGLSKKNLVVQTKMSETIFLDPVEPDQQTVHVIIRNTTGEDIKVGTYMRAALEGAGFQITRSPSAARFRIQVNVLSLEQASLDAAEAVRNAGFGGAAAVGALVGGVGGGLNDGVRGGVVGGVAGGPVGAGLEMIGGALVKDVTFMMVTDIELVQKAPNGAFVRTDTQLDSKQGIGGRARQTVSSVGDDLKYRTRIVSTANKVNLKKPDAIVPMAEGIAKSIAGLIGGEQI